jgi:hypothetical protein
VDSFGLLFYKVRWYDPLLVQIDNFSPNLILWKQSDPHVRREIVKYADFDYEDWGNRDWTLNLPVKTGTIDLDNNQEYDTGAVSKRSGMEVSGSDSAY